MLGANFHSDEYQSFLLFFLSLYYLQTVEFTSTFLYQLEKVLLLSIRFQAIQFEIRLIGLTFLHFIVVAKEVRNSLGLTISKPAPVQPHPIKTSDKMVKIEWLNPTIESFKVKSKNNNFLTKK